MRRLLSITLLLSFLLSFHAVAQPSVVAPDAPAVEAAAPTPVPASAWAPVAEVSEDIAPLLELAKQREGKSVGAVAIILGILVTITRLLRRFGSRLPGKVGEAFLHPAADYLLPIGASVVGMLFTAVLAGQAVSVPLIFASLVAGFFGAMPDNKLAVDRAIKKGEVARVETKTVDQAAEALSKL